MTLIYELRAILTLIFIEDFHRILNRFHRYRQNQTFNIFIAIETSLCAKCLLFLYMIWFLLTCISSSSSCFRFRISISCFCCSGDISVYRSKYKMRTLINMKTSLFMQTGFIGLDKQFRRILFSIHTLFSAWTTLQKPQLFDKTMTYRFI